MKIAFFSSQLSERGTETALIDYAFGNKEYLGNESVLIFPSDRVFNKERFAYLKNFFDVFTFSTISELNTYLVTNGIDLFYAIVDGEGKDITDEIKNTKTFVHCVFSTARAHGTFYCAIHPYLNRYFHTNYPVLPHIVNLFPDGNENFREHLNIPENALVIGSYAGKDRFDIRFVQDTLIKTAKENRNIYFLFMNICDFVSEKLHKNLDNIIFMPGSTDLLVKKKFINSCNAMIHARSDGETFGLSVGEFSILNKPIITYKPNLVLQIKELIKSYAHKRPGYACAHLMNLGKKSITYKNSKQLSDVLLNFEKYYSPLVNYDCFSEKFNPPAVMRIFNEIIKVK